MTESTGALAGRRDGRRVEPIQPVATGRDVEPTVVDRQIRRPVPQVEGIEVRVGTGLEIGRGEHTSVTCDLEERSSGDGRK